MLTRRLLVLAALVAPLVAPLAAGTISTESLAQTPDKLKVAISQRGFWDSSFLEFAQKEGFLKEANLDVEFFYTEGGGQTLQVVTSGSVDVAMSNGLLGTVGAFSKGAPIRVISAQMTGAHELFWYVKSDSKIRGMTLIQRRDGLFGLEKPELWPIILLTVVLNIAAQLGDLVESLIKRGAGVKDSGAILPGHGGMLDRIDALLFAAPILWLWAAWRVTQ